MIKQAYPNPNPNPNQAFDTVARRGLKLSLFASPWSGLGSGLGLG